VMGVTMRRFGQEVIEATAGKKIHGTGAIPGGVNKPVDRGDREHLRGQIDEILTGAERAVNVARDYTLAHRDTLAAFADFESAHMSLVRHDGALDLYDGDLRCLEADGTPRLDDVPVDTYADVLGEEVRSWSYMKFPFVRALGPRDGWYRVGPLARMNTCDFVPSRQAEIARRMLQEELGPELSRMTMAYHWARMIELLHAAEVVRDLLDDPEIVGRDFRARGERRTEAVGAIEAPRGTLLHHYEVDERDQVVRANLIVSTTHNNEAMNRSVLRVAEEDLQGVEITEGLLNHVEVAIRAYDPCLSCATHAMGRMPLVVQLHDSRGEVIAERARS